MEASRARKGFMKGKLVMSLYRAAKPVSSSTMQYNSSSSSSSRVVNVNPSPSVGGFVINHHDYYVAPPSQPMHKVIEITGRDSYSYAKFDQNNNNNLYGVAADESVDLKAASYISCVQERFRLDLVN